MGLFKKTATKPREKEVSTVPTANTLQHEEKGRPEPRDDHEYPSGLKFVLLMTSIFIAMFLVALVCSPSHTPQ